ncbi:GerA spore germination protein [Alteribacillus persepolensis]|uniref:GerA spore germination protein n=1 Tax=Alteribacillus persepolensis TaxID=568899 RepID=A0A1G7ZKE2_9BACI|nr:spore germination protein [Alteribacillus persepolensis]SDH09119.1 GerA spore germination protein [Alteribacillus persepolensis]
MKFLRRKQQFYAASPRSKNVSEWLAALSQNNEDFIKKVLQTPFGNLTFWYYNSLIDHERLNVDICKPLKSQPWKTAGDVERAVYVDNTEVTSDITVANDKLLSGFAACQLPDNKNEVLFINAPADVQREVSVPETEFSVIGPQESFVEKLETNIFLVRKRLPIEDLRIRKIGVGTLSKTETAILYIDGIADDENVQTVEQRIKEVQFDEVLGTNALAQMIQDHSMTVFPQFVNTERPDRVAASLAEGKVIFMTNGSPEAIVTPSTLVEFFTSLEDYYLPWYIASFVRVLRLFSFVFSVFATPVYVAVLTYHYELIPKDLLATIIASRSNIPFPPVLEALFLEFTIELLREAGARLPTKVGQTIGIVGGIVIGQASVEAGLTSNILLIVVALAALASFTAPVYQMGNTVRVIRFPFIIFAALFGAVGIALTLAFFLAHLIRLESIGRPYLSPFYPLRLADWKDTFVRLPYSTFTKRPTQMRPESKKRMSMAKADKEKDIDE